MATYSLPTGHQYLEARVNWSYTQNISANTSTVTAYVEARRTSSYMTTMDGYSPKLTFWIDGQERIQYVGYNFANYAVNTWFSIGSTVSATVGHNNDGAKSLNIATLYDTTISNFGNLSKVQSVALATIPRASVATNGWNWNAGADTVISIERKSADYYHTVYLDMGYNNAYTNIVTKTNVGTSVNSAFTQAQQALIAQKMIDSGNPADIQSRIRVITYNSGGTQIGSEFQYGGLIHRPSESTISSQGSLELATTGVPYTLSGVYSSPWITHSLKLYSSIFNKTITLANGASTTGNITLTQAQIDAIYALYTTQTYAPFNIELTTLLAGKQLGAKKTVASNGNLTFNTTAIAPNFTVTPTYSDTNATITAITLNNQHIIQNKSNLRISIPATTGVPKYGATATTYAVAVNGVEKTATYSTSAVTIDFGLVNVGTNTTAQVSVIDSRGARTTKSINITVFAYSNPTIAGSAARANGFDSNTAFSASGAFSSVNAKNTITNVKYRYKATTTGTWGSYVNLTATPSGATYATNAPVVSLDNTASFNIEFVVTDKMGGTSTVAIFLDTGKPIMFIDKAKKSVGVGKFPTNSGSFETAGNSYVGGSEFVTGNLTVTGTGGNVYTTSKKPTPSEIGAVGMPSQIPASANLNNYQTAGMYYCPADATVVTISNRPTNFAFSLLIEKHAGVRQTVSWYQTANVASWTRNYYNGVWGAWEEVHIGNIGQVTLSLENGCSNLNDAAGTYSQASVMKNSQGLVVLQGLVKGGTKNMALTTLPSGWRPLKRNIFIASTDGAIGRLDILPDGKIIYVDGNTGYISLSGLCFYANR